MRFLNFSAKALFAAALLIVAAPDRAAASPGITSCAAFNGTDTGPDHASVAANGFTPADRVVVMATVVSQMSTTAGNYTLTVTHGTTETRTAFVASGATVTLGPIKISGVAGLNLLADAEDDASAATPATVTLTYLCGAQTSLSIDTIQSATTMAVAGATVTSTVSILQGRTATISSALASPELTSFTAPVPSNLGGPERREPPAGAKRGLQLWSDARITGADDDSGDGYHFTQLNTLSGADYRLTGSLLIGAMVGFETAQSELGSADMDSQGVSIGGYLAWRFRPNLVLDLAAYKTFADYDLSTADVSA